MNGQKEMDCLEVSIKVEEGATPPEYATAGAAGADVRAYLQEPMRLPPGARALVPTGLRFSLPEGYEIQIRPRSGLALKQGITLLNAPGTIDADYRGEVGVILVNHGQEEFVIEPGMRIAQLVVAPVVRAQFVDTRELAGSARGEGGFGHTGFR